jgi:hypothetical protein
MTDQTVIRPTHLAPMVTKPFGPSWDTVLREDMAATHNRVELHAQSFHNRLDLHVRAMEKQLAEYQERMAVLEARWYERLHRWLKELFTIRKQRGY